MTPTRLRMWPPLPPGVWLRRPTRAAFPLEAPGSLLLRKARQALYFGIQGLGLRAGDEILLPAYHHGSEVEALLRAGLSIRFYDVDARMAPDPEQLEALIDGSTRALHLTHFLGRPQDAPAWREWCDDRALLLIEDAAQAWLGTIDGRPVGSWGDISIFCLYKTLGVPDGGVLAPCPPESAPTGRTPHGVRLLLRRHLAWALNRLPHGAPWGRAPYDPDDYDPAGDFDLGDPSTPVSRATKLVLERALRGDVAERRRTNHRYLLGALESLVPEGLRELLPGASPFVFPIASAAKAAMLDHLHVAGIDCLNLWTVPHPSLREADFPIATRFRRTLVGLPVHQDLKRRDLDRIVAEVNRARNGV